VVVSDAVPMPPCNYASLMCGGIGVNVNYYRPSLLRHQQQLYGSLMDKEAYVNDVAVSGLKYCDDAAAASSSSSEMASMTLDKMQHSFAEHLQSSSL
jgi:hypothetical protein